MKILKIKLGLFSLLAIFTVSVFLTSCEQELLAPQQEEDINIPLDADEYLTLTPDVNSIPEVSSVPEKTLENTATSSLSDRACLKYNSWNYFEQIGDIYVYEYPASWVWSSKYQDFIWLYNQTDICDYGLMFHTHKPICGKSGLMWDRDGSDNTLWQHNNGWQTFNCGVCDNNDFSSRFQSYITQYSHLEGTAACCGATNLVKDLTNFRDLVQTNAPLDIKNSDSFLRNLGTNDCGVQFFGREVAVDVPGNILYGFIGHLYWKNRYPNNSSGFLKAAAGLAQGISDGKLDGGPGTTGLLAFQDEWLCLTSYDPWCDTYAVGFGSYLAEKYGANITYQEFQNGMNWVGAYLHDASYNCSNNSGQSPYSPTGLVDCRYP